MSPPGLTWHHHEDLGRLSLVDRTDHSSNHALYHPTGKGGRDIWVEVKMAEEVSLMEKQVN
ncbi:HNH endonuclease [uncultured Weeksella sp.]|uniref:HNH endonuclease n=1 Tax=uncultured Weeksella sp. TaxID=1161389 RepID=UPI00259AFEC9|nr:HNH endonuclease [uncultured Weeksella sp.]